MTGDAISECSRRESADGSGIIDLTLSIDVIGYNNRPSRRMEVGRADNVFVTSQAITALMDQAN